MTLLQAAGIIKIASESREFPTKITILLQSRQSISDIPPKVATSFLSARSHVCRHQPTERAPSVLELPLLVLASGGVLALLSSSLLSSREVRSSQDVG
eukprot:1761686-Rhodomonas_salina.2